ncbi:hypothetical protein CLOM_g22545 [Closterium sp. NIES-68]|nr:hypothetical protein CLOM_g22545 [Closterium sp. NIES-68]GJP72709.1 hypothetical protein CLOP_g3467 [Closterium sp. NIES-67]
MDASHLKWLQGMALVVAVALIWIAASYIVQAVEEDGLSPFIVTYICNSLFVLYIPVVELWWCLFGKAEPGGLSTNSGKTGARRGESGGSSNGESSSGGNNSDGGSTSVTGNMVTGGGSSRRRKKREGGGDEETRGLLAAGEEVEEGGEGEGVSGLEGIEEEGGDGGVVGEVMGGDGTKDRSPGKGEERKQQEGPAQEERKAESGGVGKGEMQIGERERGEKRAGEEGGDREVRAEGASESTGAAVGSGDASEQVERAPEEAVRGPGLTAGVGKGDGGEAGGEPGEGMGGGAMGPATELTIQGMLAGRGIEQVDRIEAAQGGREGEEAEVGFGVEGGSVCQEQQQSTGEPHAHVRVDDSPASVTIKGGGDRPPEELSLHSGDTAHADVDRGADELAAPPLLHIALQQSLSKESTQSNQSTPADILSSPSFRHWAHRSFGAASFKLWLGSPGWGPSSAPSPSEPRPAEPRFSEPRHDRGKRSGSIKATHSTQQHPGFKPSQSLAKSVPESRWTRGRVAGVSLAICPVWFLAQFTFNLSLTYTSVTSNTVLSCTSSLFTFALSVYLLHEHFCLRKLLSVLLCVAGTVVVALADQAQASNTLNAALSGLSASGSINNSSSGVGLSGSGNSTGLGAAALDAAAVAEAAATVASNARESLFGDVLCLMSAGFYALYTTMLRSFTPAEGGFEEMGDDEEGGEGEEGRGSGGEEEEARGEEGGGEGRVGEERRGEERRAFAIKTAGKGKAEEQEEKEKEEEERGEGEEEEVPYSTALMFGYLGLFNLFLLAPIGLLVQWMRGEWFAWPDASQWGLVIGKGLLDNVLSDYLWARAVLLTTPTAATAGLQIQIPIALTVDSWKAHSLPNTVHVIGAALVVLGFLGINSFVTFDWLGDVGTAERWLLAKCKVVGAVVAGFVGAVGEIIKEMVDGAGGMRRGGEREGLLVCEDRGGVVGVDSALVETEASEKASTAVGLKVV